MLDTEFCRQILKLAEPWRVEDVRVDKPSNRIDIQITVNRGRALFFKRQPECPRCHRPIPIGRDTGQQVLRHLNVGEMRTYLTVPVIEATGDQNDCSCRRGWAKPGSRFTFEMERLVVEGLHLLGSVNAVSKLHGISVADVRKINTHNRILDVEEPQVAESRVLAYGQAHFDEGGLEVAYIHEESVPVSVPKPAPVPSTESHDSVPAESNPVWQRLIDQHTSANVKALGLKMLLEQIRLTVASNPSEKSRIAGARILRQYFVKHWGRNKAELVQLLHATPPETLTTAAIKPRSPPQIPAEQDPSWQHLIDGRINIHSETIGLKMLLERLRLTLGSQPSPASRLAGARILRQYFLKHHARHQAELNQLQTYRPPETAVRVAQAPAVNLPAESARCWQMLIDGQLDMQTSAVGLTMLIERIRLTIGRNPSEPARLAAARVLRQYFEKYQSRHQHELRMLTGAESGAVTESVTAAGSGGQVVEFVEVPPETHPSWQKLINGELQIQTEALGLKMLLERVRLSLGTEPSEALRLAAARVLRQYFIKHRSRHRAELEQLKVA